MKYKRIEQGNRFGRLTCKERAKESGFGGATWRCSCECGAETYVSEAMLLSGVIRSCGCNMGVRAREAKTYIDGTCVEIMMSDTVSKNNTSGYRGVAKKRDKWQAYINYGGRRISLGTFATKELAAEARQEAEKKIREHLESLMKDTKDRKAGKEICRTEICLKN